MPTPEPDKSPKKGAMFTFVLKLTDQASSEELQPFGMEHLPAFLRTAVSFVGRTLNIRMYFWVYYKSYTVS